MTMIFKEAIEAPERPMAPIEVIREHQETSDINCKEIINSVYRIASNSFVAPNLVIVVEDDDDSGSSSNISDNEKLMPNGPLSPPIKVTQVQIPQHQVIMYPTKPHSPIPSYSTLASMLESSWVQKLETNAMHNAANVSPKKSYLSNYISMDSVSLLPASPKKLAPILPALSLPALPQLSSVESVMFKPCRGYENFHHFPNEYKVFSRGYLYNFQVRLKNSRAHSKKLKFQLKRWGSFTIVEDALVIGLSCYPSTDFLGFDIKFQCNSWKENCGFCLQLSEENGMIAYTSSEFKIYARKTNEDHKVKSGPSLKNKVNPNMQSINNKKQRMEIQKEPIVIGDRE